MESKEQTADTFATLINDIESALDGKYGEDQRLIARQGVRWIELLLRKNRDYGSSVFKPPVVAPDCPVHAAIRVRMSDKIARIEQLLKGNQPFVKESLLDTFTDLGAYCLLYLVAKEKEGK